LKYDFGIIQYKKKINKQRKLIFKNKIIKKIEFLELNSRDAINKLI